jgi:hypothetical protein
MPGCHINLDSGPVLMVVSPFEVNFCFVRGLFKFKVVSYAKSTSKVIFITLPFIGQCISEKQLDAQNIWKGSINQFEKEKLLVVD